MKLELHEAREKLADLAVKISAHLPSEWKLQSPREDHNDEDHARFKKGGMVFAVKFAEYDRDDRISVSCWDWPYYTAKDSRNNLEAQKTVIYPRDLYDPKEDQPSITISATKPPSQIAKDIEGRLLGEYERIWNRCKAKADQYQEHENKQRAQWLEVANLLGFDPKYDSNYQGGLEPLTVQNRSGSLHLEGYVSLEQLKAIKIALEG